MTPQQPDGYDVIGDVHGHLEPLVRLLRQLGYEPHDGVFSHPTRRAVFVGDLIDRGPDQIGVVEFVRSMAHAGHALVVMGNHEFNALAYATPNPEAPDEYLRRHTPKNTGQHAVFLDQVGFGSPRHHDYLDWFGTFPLWLELTLGSSRLRVVHACWHPRSIAQLTPMLGDSHQLTAAALTDGSIKGRPTHESIERILKGPEVSMGGLEYLDKDGHPRSNARLAWWKAGAGSLRDVALVPGGATCPDGSPFPPLPDTPIDTIDLVYHDDIPVVFGHYWHTGNPTVLAPTTACVDFSVAKHGKLVAYQWNGEAVLSDEHFVAADPRPSTAL